MATFSLKSVQRMPVELDNAWSFFSEATNLKVITPQYLNFTVLSDEFKTSIYPGQIIEYKVSPVLGIPVYWMTEITQVKDRVFFIDEQRVGPYQLWHHQHHFKTIEGGVEMTDIVHYRLPLGFLGNMANHLFIGKQVSGIFEFRFKKIEELFGTYNALT
jgi:ligand-binding SRPBCC domain-containing protein